MSGLKTLALSPKCPVALSWLIQCGRKASGYQKHVHLRKLIRKVAMVSWRAMSTRTVPSTDHSPSTALQTQNRVQSLPKEVAEQAHAELWAVSICINPFWRSWCAMLVLEVACCRCDSGYGFEASGRLKAIRCSDATVMKGLEKYLREEKQPKNNRKTITDYCPRFCWSPGAITQQQTVRLRQHLLFGHNKWALKAVLQLEWKAALVLWFCMEEEGWVSSWLSPGNAGSALPLEESCSRRAAPANPPSQRVARNTNGISKAGTRFLRELLGTLMNHIGT